MTPEGQLKITLTKRGQTVSNVEISSSRPLNLPRIFEGKTVNEALDMVRRLYGICGAAQSCAAVSALANARNQKVTSSCAAARELILLSENAREHILRIRLDWQKLSPSTTQNEDLLDILKLPGGMEAALFPKGDAFTMKAMPTNRLNAARKAIATLEQFLSQSVFAEPLSVWKSRQTAASISAWIKGTSTGATRFLSELQERGWQEEGHIPPHFIPPFASQQEKSWLIDRLTDSNANAFITSPTWQQHPCETSALTRQATTPLLQNIVAAYGCGLYARSIARLKELAEIPARMQALLSKVETESTATPPEPAPIKIQSASGSGIAAVETARGRLIHYWEIAENKVSSARILAPTEWNFHPQGPVAKSLKGLTAETENDLIEKAHLLITAIDPCVGFQVRVN